MDIKIYYRDTDCGGVVYYANYLDYFERARTEWMEARSIGVDALMKQGVQFIVKNASVEYISPARYGETITVDTRPDAVTGASINFSYVIREKETGRKIVTGKTLLVCIDGKLRPCRLPKNVAGRLTSGMQ